MKIIISILQVFLFIQISLYSLAQTDTWIVPEKDKAKVSPFKFTEETRQKGAAIFTAKCMQCHGEPGKAGFAKMLPSPGDPATEKFSKQIDGELFYKITTGRTPMLSFKEVLTEEERWNVISYIRSFHKNYVQPEPVKPKDIPGKNVQLKLEYQKEKGVLKIQATGELNGQIVNIQGAAISLFTKRYFGNLQIDKSKITNSSGFAVFSFPSDLPGDKTGDLKLLIKFADESENFPEKVQETTMKIGVPTNKPSLTATRAMWTVRSQAPVWLIIAYCGCVLLVFGIIGYILKEIGRIRNIKG